MTAVQLLGLCYEGDDNAVGGAATGPAWMRWGLETIETFSLWQDAAVPALADEGDRYFLHLPPAAAVDAMAKSLQRLLTPQAPFCILGGDHLITLPVVQWALAAHPELAVVSLDAHLDRRTTHGGVDLSHATVMTHVAKLIGPERLYTLGVRSRAPEEPWDRATMYTRNVAAPLAQLLAGPLAERPIYLSLDLDVLDPALMPAVSNAEAGGIDFAELAYALRLLRGRLIGADVVEFVATAAAPIPAAEIAATALRETLISIVT